MIYGRDFEEVPQKIEEIIGEVGEVVIQGKILKLDAREIKNEKTIIIFDVTDFTDTITVKKRKAVSACASESWSSAGFWLSAGLSCL